MRNLLQIASKKISVSNFGDVLTVLVSPQIYLFFKFWKQCEITFLLWSDLYKKSVFIRQMQY